MDVPPLATPPLRPMPQIGGGLKFRDTRYERELRPYAKSGSVRYVWMKVWASGQYQSSSPSRPPNAVVRNSLATDGGQASVDAAKDVEAFYAVIDRWSFDIETPSPGQTDLHMSYGPAFASFDLAEAWFKSPASESWKIGAQACTLFSYTSLQGYDGPPLDDDADRVMKAGVFASCGRENDRRPGGFPDSDWKSVYRILASEKTCEGEQVFDEVTLEVLLDCDWDSRPDEVDECRTVAALVAEHRALRQPELTAAREAQIAWEANGLKACGALMLGAMRKPAGERWLELSGLLRQSFEHILYRLKCQYNRKRPKHVCNAAARPMFDEQTHDSHPGHPAFPAGHATTAYLVATLLDRTFPGHTDKLMQIAGDITLNREVAGLHFPSDSEAGKKLGIAMAEMILDFEPSPNKDPQMTANRKQLCDLVASL